MLVNLRVLSGIIQKFPAMTNTLRIDLGLPVPMMPGPIPVPANPPALNIVSVSGRTVKIRLHDAASTIKRGRPPGVAGASVFSYVGLAAPTDAAQWKYEGNATRTKLNVSFPDTVASGAAVWLTAWWYNPRAQRGPGCAAVGTNIQGGPAMAA